VINGDSGEILEAAVDEVVVLPDTADARIGMEAGNDRIGIFHDKALFLSKRRGPFQDPVTGLTAGA
jgi:hypothetical protein